MLLVPWTATLLATAAYDAASPVTHLAATELPTEAPTAAPTPHPTSSQTHGLQIGCWALYASVQYSEVLAVPTFTDGVSDVSTNEYYSCAVDSSDMGVECWGYSDDYTPGGYPPASPTVSGGVKRVSSGREHTCVVTAAGGIDCFALLFGSRD